MSWDRKTKPVPPFPEPHHPKPKNRKHSKPWKVETRYTEQAVENWARVVEGVPDLQRKARMQRKAARMRSWGTINRYRTEEDAREGLRALRKNRPILRDVYEYRLVDPDGKVIET